jgi:hypothetical protein
VLAALLVLFVVLVAAIAALVYREPRGRHHLHMRTRVRVYLGRRHR